MGNMAPNDTAGFANKVLSIAVEGADRLWGMLT